MSRPPPVPLPVSDPAGLADGPWPATFAPAETDDIRPESKLHTRGPWRSLGQFWQPAGPEAGFRPGRACATWHGAALTFTLLFRGRPAGNRARRLNERTWELGDVGEVFLQIPGRPDYWEFHVTPENQRLQLHWPPGGLAALRSGNAPLDQFTLGARNGLRSTATVEADGWRATLAVSAATLGLANLSAGLCFRAAVCRYDCGGTAAPVCSSTAPLREMAFHRPDEWPVLTLCPP